MGSREGEAEPGLGTGEGSPTGGVDAEGAQWVGRGGEEAPGPGPRGCHGNPQGCGHKGLRTVLAQSPEVPPLHRRSDGPRENIGGGPDGTPVPAGSCWLPGLTGTLSS